MTDNFAIDVGNPFVSRCLRKNRGVTLYMSRCVENVYNGIGIGDRFDIKSCDS